MKMHSFKLENPQRFFSSEYNKKLQLEEQKFTCKNGLLEMEPKAINLKIGQVMDRVSIITENYFNFIKAGIKDLNENHKVTKITCIISW